MSWAGERRLRFCRYLLVNCCLVIHELERVQIRSQSEKEWFERIITIHLTCFRYTCNIQLLYSLNNPGRDMGRVEHRIMLNGSLFNGSSDLVNHAVIGNCSDIFWTWCCSSLVLTETIISRVVLRNALFPPDIKSIIFNEHKEIVPRTKRWTKG